MDFLLQLFYLVLFEDELLVVFSQDSLGLDQLIIEAFRLLFDRL